MLNVEQYMNTNNSGKEKGTIGLVESSRLDVLTGVPSKTRDHSSFQEDLNLKCAP